jgi:Mg-chelatase subunit ChlD
VDAAGANARTQRVAREIARIDRLEAAGLDAGVGLVHQARLAIDRGDPRRLYAALVALDDAAAGAGDAPVLALTGRGVARMWEGDDPSLPGAADASMRRSAEDLLGRDVSGAVRDAFATGREASHEGLEDELASHVGERAELELLRSCVMVDGCFEVGGALAPVRVVEEDRVLRQVRHPTPELLLVPAREVEDLADAVVTDPRTVLLDLAAGRLLARRYVRTDVHRRAKTRLRSEVRVYVLDGSGSMRGPRARVRDAMLVSEIATLVARIQSPGTTRCTLYYRYFDEELGPVTRVDGVASAKAAILHVVTTVRDGGTDIQRALLASLAQIEEARRLDGDLARAQIVLVTDGEAAVDEAAIVAARDAIRGLPIGVSVVALGEENPALRALVAHQRAKGEPAFYHFLDDERLRAIATGELDVGLPVHLPEMPSRSPAALARELEAELGSIVDELASLDRARDVAALEDLDLERQARHEAGLDATEGLRDGDRARLEALGRDRLSLEARFARWFPDAATSEPSASPHAFPAPGSSERDDVEAVTCALASVAEVVALLGGSDLGRRADAIELLERLLPDARVTPSRYRAVLRDWPAAVASPLAAVHAAVRATAL